MSLSEISEILGLFVNAFTADDENSLRNGKTYPTNLNAIISEIKKFLRFFVAMLKSLSNFEHFEKKLNFIVYEFPYLETAKDVVR